MAAPVKSLGRLPYHPRNGGFRAAVRSSVNVTLQQIADDLGLSISTVSYAINGGPKPVSAEVRERVQEAAKRMGYRPNRVARSLATGRTHTIGIVPADVGADVLLQPHIQLALNGIFNAAAQLRQDLMIFTAHDRDLANSVADELLGSRVDGVVLISPRIDSAALRRFADARLPYAIVADDHGPLSFTLDNGHGANKALTYLYELGHRRIAHVSGDFQLQDARDRRDAFLAFMKEKNLPITEDSMLEGDYNRESGRDAALRFLTLDPKPTAIFCANDLMAFGFIETLHKNGLRCPEDVSVVGFDDIGEAGYFSPTLTTLRQPIQAMAAEALHAVIRHIDAVEEVQGRVFEPELIIRGSTAPIQI